MTTTTATKTAKATWNDCCGNTMTLAVRNGRVTLCNQHRIALSLSNVMFLTSHNGTAAQDKALREAVKDCKDSAALVHAARMATKISGWTAA